MFRNVEYQSMNTVMQFINAVKQGVADCERFRFIFRIKEDDKVYFWSLVDIPDFPDYEEIFSTESKLLDALKIIEVVEN